MPRNSKPFDYEPVTPSGRNRSGEADTSFAGPAVNADGKETWVAEVQPPAERATPLAAARQGWKIRRGHGLSYLGLLLFTIVVYFRPQEYYLSLAAVPIALIAAVITLMAFIPTQLALEGNLTSRPREVHLVLLLSLAALLSVPLAISRVDALNTLWEPFLKAVIVFIVIVNVVRTERRLKGMFYLAIAVTCFLSIGALNDYRLGNLSVEGYRIKGNISGGMFEGTNELGIHLVTMFPLLLALGLGARNVFGKLFYWAVGLLALATIVITFSRGGFIGLVAVVAMLAWKLGRRKRAPVVLATVLGILLFAILTPSSYWIRVLSIIDPSLDAFGSSSIRSELLTQSFMVALRHPLFGIGIGNFTQVSIRSLVSHNSYTQVGAEMGLIALLLYAMFMTAPITRLRQIERETLFSPNGSRFYFLAVGLQASLVGYMVSSFFASVPYYWFVYYLVGYAVCFRRIYNEAKASGKVEPPVEGALLPDSQRVTGKPIPQLQPGAPK